MKRVMETMEAVSRVNHPALHLVVVGPGTPELTVDQCRARAKALSSGCIHVMGPSFGSEKRQWLLGADAFISLSHRENFNYAAAEALSAELPIILSPGNDLGAELVEAGAGWILHSFERAEEVNAIRQFADLPAEKLAAIGAAGRRWAAAKLSEEAFAATLSRLMHGSLPEALTHARLNRR
jgi:glycosyltransferase involved in cell wall biosynthesis